MKKYYSKTCEKWDQTITNPTLNRTISWQQKKKLLYK